MNTSMVAINQTVYSYLDYVVMAVDFGEIYYNTTTGIADSEYFQALISNAGGYFV